MNYLPDVLGPGFEQVKLQMEPDQFSPRSATLIRYLPSQDPKSALPDRVVPNNLLPGGGQDSRAFSILPPYASPQQREELDIFFSRSGFNRRCPEHPMVAEPLSEEQQNDLGCLRDYLEKELRGREISLASQWPDAPAPSFILLYIHGWNDYFYQTHLARVMSHFGAAFYALDLHRYGRNMPDWSGWVPYNCYTDDFRSYDEEIDWAVETARAEHPDLPVVLMGHSNGGGVVSSWAARHHDSYDALIFNSPWIVHDVSTIPGGEKLRDILVNHGHGVHIPLPQAGLTTYSDSLVGYHAIGSPLPRRLIPFQNDPSVKGWIANPQWRIMTGAPTLIGWISAVLRNQKWLLEEAEFPNKPVLCLTGNHHLDPFYLPEVKRLDEIMQRKWKKHGYTPLRQRMEKNKLWLEDNLKKVTSRWQPPEAGCEYRTALVGWTEAARHTDTVLNGDLIEQRVKQLFGDNLTCQQLSGYHDLTLSQPLERAQAFAQMGAWLADSGILQK